jgi:hypothetical protein
MKTRFLQSSLLAALALLPALLGCAVGVTATSAPTATPSPHPAGGFVPNPHAPAVPQVAHPGNLRQSFDLSSYNPPVGNQADLNSCVAWATGYYLRGWYAKRDGYYPPGGFAPMYTYAQIVHGDRTKGTTFAENLDIQLQQGLDNFRDYAPYAGDGSLIEPTDAERTNAARYKIKSYSDFKYDPINNENQTPIDSWIKSTLAGGDPIVIGFPIYAEFEDYSPTSWFVTVPADKYAIKGLHAAFAFKYDSAGLWIENQFGTGWKAKGYAELSWDFVKQFALEAVTIVPSDPLPAWQRLPSTATDIAVGAKGAVWAIGTNPVYGGFGISHWNGSTWSAAPGGAVRISISPDNLPWVINRFGNIFKWRPRDDAISVPGAARGDWISIPGAARDVAIDGDGRVWIVGYASVITDKTARTNASIGVKLAPPTSKCSGVGPDPNDGGIYFWTGSNWSQVPGGANRIAVGPDNKPWIVNSCGAIFRWTGDTWQQVPGAAMDIGANGIFHVAPTNTYTWIVGATPVTGGYSVYRWNGSGWDTIDGSGIAISVGPSGNAWVVASDGSVWEG